MRSLLSYSTTSTLEEKLTLRIKANNSGDVYIPTAGYSFEWAQTCEYDWMVSIDWNTAVEYSGLWSSTWKIRVWYGLVPLSVHTVIITPKEEDFWWLRAFWYKGTDIANSLTNIISDKSYKWYAISWLYTWDYFKAYQYYWCTNLINTDEELLPDTLEIIWSNYRYYEYAGCTSLVSNADERILKTVKVIWDNYRAYQYENCTNINRIYMRAINWASVWNNYRQNQYTWIANDKKPATIYIEWGIEEGWDWWLVNDTIKNIYVYDGLVSDYQTKLSTITSSKIKKNPDWDNFEYEFIEYIALADSNGEIRIPVGWYSTSFTQDCAYDWLVSIDGWEEEEITGTGWATYVSLWSDLEEWTEHRVVIKPKTVAYWWGRAFWFHTTWAQAYIKELIHDSYKCFASNRTETGAHYKHWIFTGCTNLINSYEKLPTSVTTIWDAYMSECYAGCTWLLTAFYEVLHKWCTLWENYRYHMYTGCSSMTKHEWIAGYTGATYPTNYKYEYLSWAGNNLDVYITRYEKLASGLTNSMWLVDNNVNGVYCYVDDIYNYDTNSNWSVTKYKPRYYGYVCYEFKDIDKYTKLVASVNIKKDNLSYDGSDNYYLSWWLAVNRYKKFNKFSIAANRWGQYDTWWSGSQPQALVVEYTLGKAGDLSTTPYTHTGLVTAVQSTWSWGNKVFVWWQRYLRTWGSIWNNARNGANYDYQAIMIKGLTLVSIQSWWDITKTNACVSDNWLFARWFYGKYRLNSKFGSSWTRIWNAQWQVGLTFSNDWMKMYVWYETVKEYSLPKPWDTDNKVDTWRTLSIWAGWSFDISADGKYLFVYRSGTIYQYTYE